MYYVLFLSALINLNTLGMSDGVSIGSQMSVDKVVVEHRQKGILLGLVPISFNVKVVAYAKGNVEVEYPWFSVITIDKRDEVKTKTRVAVDNALKASALGSVRAQGEPSNPRFSAAQTEIVRKEIIRVLDDVLMEFEEEGS